ncbi:hypothetical protein V8C86DRAFT_2614448 [Haematococcus lacustris]
MQAVQDAMSALGFPYKLSDAALHPGDERGRLLAFLMSRLLLGGSLETALSRVSPDAAVRSGLSSDELTAWRYAMLLKSLGVDCSMEAVRGSLGLDSNIEFLTRLASVCLTQQQLLQLSRPSHDGGSTPPAPIVTLQAGHVGMSLQAQAKLLEHACEHIPELACDNITLFPSDMTKAIQPFSAGAAPLLAQCKAWGQQLSQATQQIECQVEALQGQVQLSSDEDWQASLAQAQQALSDFIQDVQRFMQVYEQELGVWCESCATPVTHGFGQQAQGMLLAYSRLQRIMEGVAMIQNMHAALTQSHAPLQAYHPKQLLSIAAHGKAEVAKLAHEVSVLNRAAQRAC